MKYIIKNCPDCWRNYKNVCIKSLRHSAFVNASETELYKSCKDITDCLLKRIVDECKWETNIDVECRGDLAERILSELEIEERE